MKILNPFLIATTAGLMASLVAASAHVSVGGDRTLDGDAVATGVQPIDGVTVTNNLRTVSGSFGWADGTDANWGDSHRLTPFKFTIATTQTVTITVQTRNAAGQTGPVDTLLPGFSLYTTPTFVASTHDSGVATVNHLSTTFGTAVPGESFTNTNGNAGYEAGDPFVDTNGDLIWNPGEQFTDVNGNGFWEPGDAFTDTNGNGLQDMSLGGSGKEGAFAATEDWEIFNDSAVSMLFTHVGYAVDGTAANFGTVPGITGDGLADGFISATFTDLGPGDYYLFVGGANYAAQSSDHANSTTFNTYGIGVTVGAVPEPSAGLLVALGTVGLTILRRKRNCHS